MFGVVKQVNDFELVVSLPNHLTAYVSCNRVSKHLDALFTAYTSSDDSESVPAPPKLSDFYQEGDSVIGTIVCVEGQALPGSDEPKKRKRIEISLIPSQVNADMSSSDLQAGLVMPVEITSVEDKGYVVDLGVDAGKVVGFLPFGQSKQTFKVGSVVMGKITSNKGGRVVNFEVFENSSSGSSGLKNFNQIRPGTLLENVEVKCVTGGAVEVIVNGIHNGQIDTLNLPVENTLINHKNELGLVGSYAVGSLIPLCRVVFSDYSLTAEEKPMILSALPSILGSDSLRREVDSLAKNNCAVGQVFNAGKIVRVDQGLGVIVDLMNAENGSSAGLAQVHISRLADEKITKIAAPYKVNSVHACRVIDYDAFASMAIASMAPSCLAQTFLSIDSIEVGSIVRGEIVQITPGLGLLVKLSDRIRGLCPTAQVTETQSEDSLKSFRLGQQFKFRVLSTDASARRIMLSRKKGLLDSELKPLLSYDSALVGEFYDGYVASIRPFGCIVRFYNNIRAILPLGELSEDYVTDASKIVFEGQVVRVRVIKLDKDAQQMVVSLRKSDGPKTGSKRKAAAEAEKKEATIEKKEKKVTVMEMKVSVTEAKPEVEEPRPKKARKQVEEEQSVEVVSPPVSPVPEVKATIPSLRDLEEEELAKEDLLSANTDASTLKTASLPKPSAEELLSMKEMCEEYERRLLGSPNSSMLWIQYMSVLIKSMEIDAARELANRALQTISIRAEEEKLNIWIALMNLEHSFGNEESLKAVFQRACVYNDTKAVHLALAKIYEESASLDRPESVKTVEDFYATHMLKKFRQSCKVWVNLAHFHFVNKKSAASGRKLLTQALEALPRRKHIKVTLQFALLEFRHGSIERGRTLFEGVLASSPSRTDIWSQYCDQEERHLPESTEALRRLFNRIVSLKLSTKKAKFFFKRFLEFEKKWGDQLTVQHVKDLAQKYVESTMNK